MDRSRILPFRFVAVLLLIPSVARAQDPPPDEVGVELDSVTYSGSGCPEATARILFSPDRRAFTVVYSDFVVEVGPGLAGRDRKDCKLHFKLRIPDGWSYAIQHVDFRGFAAMDTGVLASLESRYHLAGEGPIRVDAVEFLGPYEPADYAHRDEFPEGGLSSRCGKGRNVQIATSVRISNKLNRAGNGVVFLDAADGALHQTYHLAWTRCK